MKMIPVAVAMLLLATAAAAQIADVGALQAQREVLEARLRAEMAKAEPSIAILQDIKETAEATLRELKVRHGDPLPSYIRIGGGIMMEGIVMKVDIVLGVRSRAAAWEATRQEAIRARGFPLELETRLVEQRVWIGMTPDQARLSWGTPRSVNETITAAGRTEQWVYAGDRGYLTFTNGVLTAIQQTR